MVLVHVRGDRGGSWAFIHQAMDGCCGKTAGGPWARSWDGIAGRSLGVGAPPELEAREHHRLERARIEWADVDSDPPTIKRRYECGRIRAASWSQAQKAGDERTSTERASASSLRRTPCVPTRRRDETRRDEPSSHRANGFGCPVLLRSSKDLDTFHVAFLLFEKKLATAPAHPCRSFAPRRRIKYFDRNQQVVVVYKEDTNFSDVQIS